jgi:hypothetical protein
MGESPLAISAALFPSAGAKTGRRWGLDPTLTVFSGCKWGLILEMRLLYYRPKVHLTGFQFCVMMAPTLSGRGFVAVRLPVDEMKSDARSGANASEGAWARSSRLQLYFGFHYFTYASAVGRCPAHGRSDPC